MRWDDLRQSTNIEDDREASASRGGGLGIPGGGGGLGIGMIIILGLIGWALGMWITNQLLGNVWRTDAPKRCRVLAMPLKKHLPRASTRGGISRRATREDHIWSVCRP